MKRLLPWIWLGLLIFLAIQYHNRQQPAAEPITPVVPCSDRACIRLTTAEGTIYEINDFRMLPGNCIAFISLPDNVKRKSCGTYKFDWIGPDPVTAQKGQTT